MKKLNEKIEKDICIRKENAATLFFQDKHIKKYYSNISLTPFIVNKNLYSNIEEAMLEISKLLEKTINLYLHENTVRSFFNFRGIQKEIIENYYTQNQKLYLARFDGFVTNDKELKFLELNTNFPGGIDRLDDINQKIISFLKNKNLINPNLFRDNFIKLIKNIYQKHGRGKLLVIVYGSRVIQKEINSMLALSSIITKVGIESCTCHWKDLQFINDKLFFNKQEVSVVFRAAHLNRIWEYDWKSARNTFKAVKNNSVFIFNPPVSFIGSTKNIFALWHTNFFKKFLSITEQNIIDKYIPWTEILTNQSKIKDKNKFVLKPITGYGGEGVVIGQDIKQSQWDRILREHENKNDYIVQEYIEPTKLKIKSLDLVRQKISDVEAKINISPWLINGKMAGISGRYSKGDIINVKQGGGIIPVFMYK